MSEKQNNLINKRKKALEKLQNNRGKNRKKIQSNRTEKTEGIVKILKQKSGNGSNKQESSATAEFDLDIVEETVVKGKNKLQHKEDEIVEAVQRLKENRRKMKEIRLARQEQAENDSSDVVSNIIEQNTPQFRHQIKQDLLTADFWQQASQWLSGINTDIHLSSTPPEEVELLYKQAQHRYKALKLIMHETEEELDAFEAYFRNVESFSQLQNKNKDLKD